MKTVFSNLRYRQAHTPWFSIFLVLLAFNFYSNSARGQGVIAQSSTIGANLDALFNLPTNTVTVVSGVTIETSDSGSVAVSGSSRAWGLTNAATLNGNGTGVSLGAGGTVNNQSGGSIVGGTDGLDILNGDLAVDNCGSISGNVLGISVNHSGILSNHSGGTIAGGVDGIAGFGGPQTIVNAGTIIGTNNTAILYGHGGSVDNLPGGIILGGIFLNGGVCPVTNAGSITGEDTGVNLFSGGSLNNLTGGVITGGQNGVSVNDAASVNNAGTIFGGSDEGVLLTDGGTASNQAGGIICGGATGLEIDFLSGAADNAGSIAGTNYYGVLMTGGGSIINRLGANITGGTYGVEMLGGSGALTNAGTIIGQSGTAVFLGDPGGSVTLQTGSDVQGDIDEGGDGAALAYLQGNGSFSHNFLSFASLTVQADATGWNLAGSNTFSAATEVQSGLLSVNGTLTTPLLTVNSTGTLAGAGFVAGSVTVEPGGVISPGTTTSFGILTASSNVWLQGRTIMKLISADTNSDQLDAGNIIYGGTLVITNLSAMPPSGGKIYQLFSAASYSGAFHGFSLPPLGARLAWNWNPTNGTLAVVSAPSSPLTVSSPQLTAANIQFNFATMAGREYSIWVNTNLATPNWCFATNFIGDGLTDQVNAPIPSNSAAAFFRVSQP